MANRVRARPGGGSATSCRGRAAFTTTGRHTLRAFLDWIDGLQRAEVRDPESGSAESDEDALHIQTVHGAKGLEYPIVLVGGLAATSRGRVHGRRGHRRSAHRSARLQRRMGLADGRHSGAQARTTHGRRRSRTAAGTRTTRARDHLVLSLFRGEQSDGSAADLIAPAPRQRNAGSLCRVLVVPERTGVAAERLVAEAQSNVGAAASADAERAWLMTRQASIRAASTPFVQGSTAAATAVRAPVRIAGHRNVLLLARNQGVLVEETVDFVYDSPEGDQSP